MILANHWSDNFDIHIGLGVGSFSVWYHLSSGEFEQVHFGGVLCKNALQLWCITSIEISPSNFITDLLSAIV